MPGTTHSEPVQILVDGEPGAALNALDRGLHYGDGLFETMAVVDGKVVWAEDHLRRLAQGMAHAGTDPLSLARVARRGGGGGGAPALL